MKDFKKLIREAHLGNPLNEDKLPDGFHSKEDLDQFLKDNPFDSERYKKLSIAQKQDILSYLNRDTEKEFERRMAMREELKLGVKYELPTGETGYIMTGGSKDPKDWKFSANKESYLSVKDKLKPTKKQPGKYDGAYDMGMGKGHHVDEGTCGYGEDGVIGDKPAGAHLQKEDMNDPVLVKTRAAQMKRDAMDKKDLENKSKRISVDKAIDLRYELSILDKEREDILMRIEDIAVEMDQTAEPEGGPIADKLGERLMAAQRELRAIDSKIIDIKDDLGVFDMNESVKEDLQLDVNLYNRENPSMFSKADEKVQVTIPGGFDNNEGDTALEKALAKLGKKYTSYKVKDVKELNEDDEVNVDVDDANTNYAKAIEKESDSAAYESLQETLRKKLQDRLK